MMKNTVRIFLLQLILFQFSEYIQTHLYWSYGYVENISSLRLKVFHIITCVVQMKVLILSREITTI